ncbi:MAG: hypothetical protein Q4C96_07505 [Planctomycetia bacterium]|nr:hypothetical protein [Planctomycetia bacterium]
MPVGRQRKRNFSVSNMNFRLTWSFGHFVQRKKCGAKCLGNSFQGIWKNMFCAAGTSWHSIHHE